MSKETHPLAENEIEKRSKSSETYGIIGRARLLYSFFAFTLNFQVVQHVPFASYACQVIMMKVDRS